MVTTYAIFRISTRAYYSSNTQRVDKYELGGRMQLVSLVGDPELAFVLFFPLVAAMNATSGTRFAGAIIVCEWLNQILKWLFKGERPFWYFHEKATFNGNFNPNVF